MQCSVMQWQALYRRCLGDFGRLLSLVGYFRSPPPCLYSATTPYSDLHTVLRNHATICPVSQDGLNPSWQKLVPWRWILAGNQTQLLAGEIVILQKWPGLTRAMRSINGANGT